MSARTDIEWTDATWNPVTGCTKVSPGCDHCYAEAIVSRFGAPAYPNGFDVTGLGRTFEDMVRNIASNQRNNERRADLPDPEAVEWPLPNVWLGVSTETQNCANMRIPALLDAPAAVRFISAEPLIGPIDLGAALGTYYGGDPREDELAGRDLMCWCPLSSPCHADVLLELANGSES